MTETFHYHETQVRNLGEIETPEGFYEYVKCTPIEKGMYPMVGGKGIDVKMESEQAFGSFKTRAAVMELLSSDALRVVTSSAGSFGIPYACVGRELGKDVTVFAQNNIAPSKAEPIQRSGAHLITKTATGPISDYPSAEKEATLFAKTTGAEQAIPYDGEAIIAGNMTLFSEILEAYDEMEPITLFVAVGGGGQLAAACAVALKHPERAITIVAVQYNTNTSLEASLAAGEPTAVDGTLDTTCEGTAVRKIGALPFALAKDAYDAGILEIITVTPAEVGETMYIENIRLSELSLAIGETMAYEHFPETTGLVAETGALQYSQHNNQDNAAWVAVRSGSNTDPTRELLVRDAYQSLMGRSALRNRTWLGPQVDRPRTL